MGEGQQGQEGKQEETGQHLPGRSGRGEKGKDNMNLHVKKDLSLADQSQYLKYNELFYSPF